MKTVNEPYRRSWIAADFYGRIRSGKVFELIFSQNKYILIPAAFLLGRVDIANGLMPFGFAFFAASFGCISGRLIIAMAVMAGMLTNAAPEQIYTAAAAMLLFSVFMMPLKKSKSSSAFKYALLAFFSMFLPLILLTSLQGFLLYDFLRSLFCAFIAFILFFVYKNSFIALAGSVRNSVLSSEESISVVITAALVLSGLGSFQVLGFSLKNILCIIMILLFSYKCGPGVGAAAGVSIGLIVSMSTNEAPLYIGAYALCGLLSGIFRKLNKVGSGLGFVMGSTILTIYLGGSAGGFIHLKEIIVSVLIFILIPQKFIEFISGPFRGDGMLYEDRRGYSRRIKDITVEKLEKFSRAFKELSKTFDEISQTKVATEKNDISMLFDRVADRICSSCSLCLHCWDRNFYDTYQAMFKIVEVLEAKGRVDDSDIPQYFLERCERLNDFLDAINNMYELFKVDMVWKGRVSESRGLISQQFEGMSNVISGLADEINTEVNFISSLEDKIFVDLSNAGVKVREVIAYQDKSGKYEVSIYHAGCGGARLCVSTIEKVVSKAVGRRMAREGEECMRSRDGNCTLRLVEEENLKLTANVAKLAKFGSEVSGDSFTFLNDERGKYIVALSDGMGSGYKASLQSKATVDMLENFLQSGFDKDMAVNLINSVLVLKSADDSYSTIDMSIIDLFTGEVEFVKIGAVSTYIKKPDRVEVVKSVSLPAGILTGIDAELAHRRVEYGDMIIMLTDGVIDSFSGEEQGERVILKYIQEISSINPQQVADNILDEAISRCDGKAPDDMTVIVAKVWKKTR